MRLIRISWLLSEAGLRRRLRRMGLPSWWSARAFGVAAAVAVAMAAAVAAAIGATADDWRGGSWTGPSAVLAAGVLLTGWLAIASGTPNVVIAAMRSERSWILSASTGVTPAEFIVARFLALGAMRLLLAVVIWCSMAGGAVAVGTLSVAEAVAGAALLFAVGASYLGVTTVVGLRALDRSPQRDVAARLLALIPYVISGAAVGLGLATLLADAQQQWLPTWLDEVHLASASHPGVVLGAAAALVATAVAAWALIRRSLSGLTWPEVSWRAAGAMPSLAGICPQPLPGRGPFRAVLAADVRRAGRSAPMRLRPVLNLLGFAVFGIGLASGWALFGTGRWLPRGVDPLAVQTGVAALVMLALSHAAKAVTALDADRSAYVLWARVGNAMEVVAAVRSGLAVVVPLVIASPVLVASSAALGLGGRGIATGLLALCAVAFASALVGTMVSLLVPKLGWTDIGEVGTDLWLVVFDYLIYIPAVVVYFLVAGAPGEAILVGTPLWIAAGTAILVAAPLSAFCAYLAVPRVRGWARA